MYLSTYIQRIHSMYIYIYMYLSTYIQRIHSIYICVCMCIYIFMYECTLFMITLLCHKTNLKTISDLLDGGSRQCSLTCVLPRCVIPINRIRQMMCCLFLSNLRPSLSDPIYSGWGVLWLIMLIVFQQSLASLSCFLAFSTAPSPC